MIRLPDLYYVYKAAFHRLVECGYQPSSITPTEIWREAADYAVGGYEAFPQTYADFMKDSSVLNFLSILS